MAIVSPFYYKLCPESVYAYFREIALNSPIDVTLYNIPMFASPIDVPTIRRLAEFERIVGIKDSSGDLAFMMRMIAAVRPIRPDFVFLTGWDAVLVPMLLIGCDGGTNATSGVVPELTRKLYDLIRAGQIDEAMRLQFRLLELFDTMLYSADFPEGFRAAVELRGFKIGPQPPAAERQAEDRLRSRCKTCCSASWPISATSKRPPAAARRGPATSTRTASATSRPPCLKRCGSGVPCERGRRIAGNDRPDGHAGGGRRDGEGGRRARDPVRAERLLRRLHEDRRQHGGREHRHRGRPPQWPSGWAARPVADVIHRVRSAGDGAPSSRRANTIR